MQYPKYINTETGEVCFNFKELLHSSILDLKHFKVRALSWIFSWKHYKAS